jgi:hypothetical protein
VGGVAGFSAWDPTTVYHTTPPAAFSNNNRTITTPAAQAYSCSVRGTKSHNTGKFYFEVTFATADGNQAAGVVNPSWIASGSGLGLDANSAVVVGYGSTYAVMNANSPLFQSSAVWTNGDVIGTAVDFTTGSNTRVYFRVNTLWLTANSTTFNAATPDFSWGAITTLFTSCSGFSVSGNTSVNTLNVGNAAFANAPPAGFVAWG